MEPPQGFPAVRPLAAVTTAFSRGTVKVTVVDVADIRTVNGRNGPMRVQNWTLVDADGTKIRGSGFDSFIDAHGAELVEGATFFITGCAVRAADARYNRTGHPCELSFNDRTRISRTETDLAALAKSSMRLSGNLKQFAETANAAGDFVVVVLDVGSESTIRTKRGDDLVKREITVADSSNVSLSLTLWGEEASTFAGTRGSVLLVNGASRSEFMGKVQMSLPRKGFKLADDSKLSGEVADAVAVQRKWWSDTQGRDATAAAAAAGAGAGAGGREGTRRCEIRQIESSRMGMEGERVYITVSGYMGHHSSTFKPYYLACPDCKKRVQDGNACPKCGKQVSEPMPTWLLRTEIKDWTGATSIGAFGDKATELVGISAADVHAMYQSSPGDDEVPQDLTDLFEKLTYKRVTLRLGVSSRNMQNDPSRQVQSVDVIQVYPFDAVKEGECVAKDISAYIA